jgi:hypothetical protein
MTNVMKVLARANGWELVQDLNSCISLYHGSAIYMVSSAIEGLREIPDMETRRLMAKQIFGGGN